MCGIVRFLPGQTIEDEKLFNLVHNNWHSYGYVIKDGNGGMDVQRVVPETGENDPKEIWKILKDNQDLERILHVRHNTAGATNIENCHPFPVLFIPKKGKKAAREIVFMHNGTMSDYKSKYYDGAIAKDDPDGASDTLNFVEQVLQPMLQADYGTGAGDLSNPVLRKIIEKFWPYGNRGVLIANDQPSWFLGEWKEYGVGDILKVSTIEYFDKVTRGPEYSRRIQKENEERSRRPSTPIGQAKLFSNLRDHNFEEAHGFYKLSESPVNILSDWEVYDREHGVSVANFTRPELEQIYADKTTCIDLMEWIFTDYGLLYNDHCETVDKHDRATKRIAGQAEELKKLSKGGK